MRAILKDNTANYISLESLINVDFGKNINCRFLQFRKRTSQSTAKITMCHSIELIGYQTQAHWVSAFFDILTGYFLICQVREAKNARWALH